MSRATVPGVVTQAKVLVIGRATYQENSIFKHTKLNDRVHRCLDLMKRKL